MSTYRAAENHNVALGSLTVLSPQPRTDGVKPTRRSYLADGTIVEEGLHVEFTWSSLRNISAYQTMLAVFGLDTATSGNVTIYAKNARMTWTRYNGVAVLPEPGREVGYASFPRNITLLVKNLVAL